MIHCKYTVKKAIEILKKKFPLKCNLYTIEYAIELHNVRKLNVQYRLIKYNFDVHRNRHNRANILLSVFF